MKCANKIVMVLSILNIQDIIRIFVLILGGSILIINLNSCSNLIKVDPPITSINRDNAFNNDATATAVVTDILAQLSGGNLSLGGSMGNIFLFGGLAADEIKLYAVNNSGFNIFYYNSYSANTDLRFWNSTYSLIYSANTVIEGLSSNTKLTDGVRIQLLGEAKFIRAFCYFYLINLYGDVPLVLTTDVLKNATLERSSVSMVYSQIFNDLKESQNLLSENYRSSNVLNSTSERVRPNKWAAKALLARAYLYNSKFDEAEILATEVIQKSSLFSIDSLDAVFLKNSNECIWQLQNVTSTRGNTGEGNIFILPETGPNNDDYPVYLSKFVVNCFESSDQRKTHWIDSLKVDSNTVYYYPFKYKSGASTPDNMSTEYEMVLRLGEQFLIRSEARAQLGNILGAREDLNVIRKRAGLVETSANDKEGLLSAILHERQAELFTEWGHRWFDLKRTKSIDSVMNVVAVDKGITWNSDFGLWPIYIQELFADPKLVQNPGY